MANSKVIIVEGPQGVGKTTITDFIRNSISYTNLYRLCGTHDVTKSGRAKSIKMYRALMNYIEEMQNTNVNLLFDRTFFTEEIYCRLGKKDYTFTDIYEKLLSRLANLDFDIYYITLYLENENEYCKRLDRPEKAKMAKADFEASSSIIQQREYLKMADEVKEKYKNINVININNSRPLEEVKKQIKELLDWKHWLDYKYFNNLLNFLMNLQLQNKVWKEGHN